MMANVFLRLALALECFELCFEDLVRGRAVSVCARLAGKLEEGICFCFQTFDLAADAFKTAEAGLGCVAIERARHQFPMRFGGALARRDDVQLVLGLAPADAHRVKLTPQSSGGRTNDRQLIFESGEQLLAVVAPRKRAPRGRLVASPQSVAGTAVQLGRFVPLRVELVVE
jgi:hypothetical protein